MNHLDELYKKIHGDTAFLRMKVDAENIARIRMLCKEYHLSLDELAEAIEEDSAMLKAINASEQPLSNVILKKISRKYGIQFRGITKKYEEYPNHKLILEA